MRKFPFGMAILGGLAALTGMGTLHAQTAAPDAPATNDSAYSALRLMAKTLGKEALDRVVEVAGRDGVPQPYLWKIVLQEGAGSREVDVAGGKIVAQRTETKPPASKTVIHLQDLNLDSSGAFDATDAQARKVRLRFDAVNYVLRTGDATGKPLWTLSLFNQEGAEVGAMRLAANDGNIVSIDGRLASGPATPAPTSTPAVVSSSRRSEPAATPPRTTETVVTSSRVREPVPTPARVVESRTTTTTTVVNPPPQPVVTTDTVTVEDTSVDREGGLFTRTGRTLDKTSRNVEQTLRRTGSRVQRFFTGRAGDDQDDVPPPPPPPRDPNFRGD